MAKITAADVNALRKKTGAGMMDCKKALVEAEGDVETAVDILRKKGQKIASKRGERDAAEGLVIAKVTENASTGVLLVLNCETDFVAKNADFNTFANTIIDLAIANNPENIDALKAIKYPESELTVGEKIIEQIGIIGEKIDLSSFEKIESEQVVAYNHPGNQLATIVGFNQSNSSIEEVGRQVAMQVAAMAPIALDKDGVAKDVIDREIEVGKDLAIQEGKPAEMAEKIAMGRLNKFFKENTLLSQPFVRDNKKTVAQFIKESDPNLAIVEFKRIALN